MWQTHPADRPGSPRPAPRGRPRSPRRRSGRCWRRARRRSHLADAGGARAGGLHVDHHEVQVRQFARGRRRRATLFQARPELRTPHQAEPAGQAIQQRQTEPSPAPMQWPPSSRESRAAQPRATTCLPGVEGLAVGGRQGATRRRWDPTEKQTLRCAGPRRTALMRGDLSTDAALPPHEAVQALVSTTEPAAAAGVGLLDLILEPGRAGLASPVLRCSGGLSIGSRVAFSGEHRAIRRATSADQLELDAQSGVDQPPSAAMETASAPCLISRPCGSSVEGGCSPS